MTFLESVNAKNKKESGLRERHYMLSRKCVNKNIAGRTREEYTKDNKDKIRQQAKVKMGSS